MKATDACESFKSMNDQRSKSLSTLFLNTETVSYGSGYILQKCVSPWTEWLLYFLKTSVSFYTVEAAKSKQSGVGARALYHDKRLKDETDLSGISWALGTRCMAATLSGLFPFSFGLCLQAKDSRQTSMILYKDSNIHVPWTPPFVSDTHTHTLSSSVCASANRSVPSGITVQLQAMEVKRDSRSLWITSTPKLDSVHSINATFLWEELNNNYIAADTA